MLLPGADNQRKFTGKVDRTQNGTMADKLTTIQSASDQTGVDSRKLAQALLAAGEQPAATLVQPKGQKPLFHADRVALLAKALLEAAEKHSND
jgi:hypothetical protein